MKYRYKNKVFFLMLLLLGITVGYALLSATLDINGTASIKSNKWNIHWDDESIEDKGVTPIKKAYVKDTEKRIVEFSVNLDLPGDYYEFYVDAKNEGTIDGMITTLNSKVNGNEIYTLPSYVKYSVTYKNNKPVEKNQLLKASSSATYKVRVEYDSNVSPEVINNSEDLDLTFNLEITYSQADDKATTTSNFESSIMLDVARRYYPVSEIKKYIDILSVNDNSSLQLHFTDDENVGIECDYLDQTKSTATVENGEYTNPVTGNKFLTYDQVTEIMNYAKSKNVKIIPEVDVPAHMNGFFKLAINKFGEEYVRAPYDWDNPENSGIAWGSGDEAGNIDLALPQSKQFIKNIYDEYTDFFKECDYFHIGYDEYTFRPELKIDYANEIYTYLKNKGFKVRMWSDSITKENINSLNNDMEVVYWGWKEQDITKTNYATVKDLQEQGFNLMITNKYYLFFVPSPSSTTEESLEFAVERIANSWTLEKWNYNFDSNLDSYNNIDGSIICVWGEDSEGISNEVIFNQTRDMYNAMIGKLN